MAGFYVEGMKTKIKRVGRKPRRTFKRRNTDELKETICQINKLYFEGVKRSDRCKIIGVDMSRITYWRLEKMAEQQRKELTPHLEVSNLQSINKNLNPIEFCDSYLTSRLKPIQRIIIKAFYSLPMTEQEKLILLKMKREGKTTWEEGGKYKELVLIVGMKAGKTVLASFIVQIEEYLLYCMGDISTKYGFMPGEEIYIINVATNEAQAKKTIFAKTRASILRSPYYKLRRPREVGCSFEFEDNHVFIVSGHSNSSSLVGNTCKLVLFDELDRFAGSGGKYSAGEVYEALVKSTDPFKEDARVVSISSLVNSKGMMTKLYANCKKISSMLGFWLPEWEMRPEDYSGKTFSFMNINIPIEHKDGFEKNPETFMRDKASVLGFTSGTYYRLPYKVKEVFESSHNKGLISPIDEHHNFIIDLKQKDNCKYFVHGDPSKNSDSYGIALGHRENEKVIIDLVHRFKPEGIYGEINWDEVQEFCLELLRRFPSIETFTFDSWCTTGLSQTLKAQGVTVENLYVLKSQHDCLKERIYKNEFECYMYQELIDELLDLRSNGETVDHPPLGCFTGDTKISLLDGRELSFLDLIKEYGNHEKFYVYSLSENRQIKIGEAHSPRLTLKNAKILKIYLDNGEVIRCTENHKFAINKIQYKRFELVYREAKDLKVGQSLTPLYRKKSDYLNPLGYEMIRHPGSLRWVFTHRIAVGKYKKNIGNVIHHKNFNKFDNRPSNLIIMNSSEHSSYHKRLGVKTINGRSKEISMRFNNAGVKFCKSEYGRKFMSNLVSKRYENKYYLQQYTDIGKRFWTKEKAIKMRLGWEKHTGQNIEKHRQWVREYLSTDEGKKFKIRQRERILRKDITIEKINEIISLGIKTQKDIMNYFKCGAGTLARIYKESGYSGSVEFQNTINHKIIKIENGGFEDVYDITVEKYNNFALSSGVFVHNSKDVADCVAGVAWQCMYRGDSGVAPASATQEAENQSGFKNMSSRGKRRSIWD